MFEHLKDVKLNSKCNCGKEGRYLLPNSTGLSCNKYVACLPYDELLEINEELKNKLLTALDCSEILMTMKESTTSYVEAEQKINELRGLFYE